MKLQRGPTLRSELRRGVNRYNLTVGAVVACAVGAATYGALRIDLVPDLLERGPAVSAIAAGLALFIGTTALHTAMHAWFGWRFERGIAAHDRGDHAQACALLAPAASRGMSHYDEDGHALAALQDSRAALGR